ncbi:MAG: hypothetical protein H0T73_18520 [Ardenticatenales bacterium]|nr:hypothetical protein [Ardenticatenales bacterium]
MVSGLYDNRAVDRGADQGLGAVERLRAAIGSGPSALGASGLSRALVATRTGLAVPDFAVARAEGQALRLDEVMALVLAIADEEPR